MKEDKTEATKPRNRGRPKKNQEPLVPWDDIDATLVHGEKVETEQGTVVRYPSFRDIAERFGISHSLVAKYAKSHNCLKRREETKRRVRELTDIKLTELRSEEIAVRKDDILRTVDRFLIQFEEAVAEGRVRCDNPSDYNVMARLRGYIMGDADARAELICGLTLDDLEQRYLRARNAWEESTPESRGEIRVLRDENPPDDEDSDQ